MLNWRGGALTCAAWLATASAMTQAAPASPPQASRPAQTGADATLTVRASPLTRSQARTQSRSFVQTYAAPTARLGQLARWRDPVCVLVVGLVPERAATVAARIEDVAKAVGLTVGRPGCRANIEIVFTDQPQGLLDGVAERSDWILGFHYPSQTRALKTVTRPIQAWYMTASRGGGSDNVALATVIITSSGGAASGGDGLPQATRPIETLDTPRSATPNGCGGRRFSSCLQSLFKNVLVVVDNRRVQGQPLGPLTDYLAMLALSQPRSLDGCMSLPSVVDLLAPAGCPGRAAPDGLTPSDAAYLTSLYAADLEAKSAAEQSEISERMARILVNANPAPAKAPDGVPPSDPVSAGR